MTLAFAARPFGFRLEQESTVHDDRLARREPGHDFHLATEVAPTADRAYLERALALREKDAPPLVEPLQRSARHGDDGGRLVAQREPCRGRHAGPQRSIVVRQV